KLGRARLPPSREPAYCRLSRSFALPFLAILSVAILSPPTAYSSAQLPFAAPPPLAIIRRFSRDHHRPSLPPSLPGAAPDLVQGAPTPIVSRTYQFAFLVALLAAGISDLSGCAAWQLNAPPRADVPDRQTVALDQLVIHSNFDLPAQHRLLQDLNAERSDV